MPCPAPVTIAILPSSSPMRPPRSKSDEPSDSRREPGCATTRAGSTWGWEAMGPAEAEAAMIHLLAECRTAELQQVLAALPEPTPFAEVIDADLRARALDIDLPALQALEARVCADPGEDIT